MEGIKKYNLEINRKFIYYMINIGFIFCMIPSLKGKDAKIDSLMQLLSASNSDSLNYMLCRQIGDAYYEGNFDSLLVYYDKSLVFAQQMDNTREQISTLRSFAYVYRYRKNDYQKAKEYFQKTYDLTIAKNDTLAKAYILNDLGELYRAKGEKYKSSRLFISS